MKILLILIFNYIMFNRFDSYFASMELKSSSIY